MERYRNARDRFDEVLARLDIGEKFLTGRTAETVYYEVAMMHDALGNFESAIQNFDRARALSAPNSFVEIDSRYEIARLKLRLWRDAKPTPANETLLDVARELDSLSEMELGPASNKVWIYYHRLCITKLLIDLNAIHKNEYEYALTRFRDLARSLVGWPRYRLRLSAFVLISPEYVHFPGEPLRCKLEEHLREFAAL